MWAPDGKMQTQDPPSETEGGARSVLILHSIDNNALFAGMLKGLSQAEAKLSAIQLA
jgi:hypothetical protein